MSSDLEKRRHVDGVTTILNLQGYSLRTIVPSSVVKLLGLKEKDRLRWQMRVDENREIFIEVRPLRAYREE